MSTYLQRLRGEEKLRRLLWLKYADHLIQKGELPTVRKAKESSHDSALHSSTSAQQSDRRPWNYRPYTPQQLRRIEQANTEWKKRQKERNEEVRQRDRKLNQE